MNFYKKRSTEWEQIRRSLGEDGIVSIDDNYELYKGNEYYGLRLKNEKKDLCIQVRLGDTTYCCGVAQIGSFYENEESINIPDDVLKEWFKIILSICGNRMNKGILQGWFYKPKRGDKFEHPNIEKMFKLSGAKRIGQISYNPNTGNKIKGYQITIK